MNLWLLGGKDVGKGYSGEFGRDMYTLVPQSCLTLYDSMDCSTPGFPVFHYLLEFPPTHVH